MAKPKEITAFSEAIVAGCEEAGLSPPKIAPYNDGSKIVITPKDGTRVTFNIDAAHIFGPETKNRLKSAFGMEPTDWPPSVIAWSQTRHWGAGIKPSRKKSAATLSPPATVTRATQGTSGIADPVPPAAQQETPTVVAEQRETLPTTTSSVSPSEIAAVERAQQTQGRREAIRIAVAQGPNGSFKQLNEYIRNHFTTGDKMPTTNAPTTITTASFEEVPVMKHLLAAQIIDPTDSIEVAAEKMTAHMNSHPAVQAKGGAFDVSAASIAPILKNPGERYAAGPNGITLKYSILRAVNEKLGELGKPALQRQVFWQTASQKAPSSYVEHGRRAYRLFLANLTTNPEFRHIQTFEQLASEASVELDSLRMFFMRNLRYAYAAEDASKERDFRPSPLLKRIIDGLQKIGSISATDIVHGRTWKAALRVHDKAEAGKATEPPAAPSAPVPPPTASKQAALVPAPHAPEQGTQAATAPQPTLVLVSEQFRNAAIEILSTYYNLSAVELTLINKVEGVNISGNKADLASVAQPLGLDDDEAEYILGQARGKLIETAKKAGATVTSAQAVGALVVYSREFDKVVVRDWIANGMSSNGDTAIGSNFSPKQSAEQVKASREKILGRMATALEAKTLA